MNLPPSQFAARWLPWVAPWSVLIVGLAATATLAVSTHREMMARDEERFKHAADELVARLESHLRRYGQALMGMRHWYTDHQGAMTERTWTNYIYTLYMPANYPGLYNIGFVEKVLDKNSPAQFPEREAHLQRMRARLGREYNLHLPPGGVKDNVWFQMPVIWHSYGQWRLDPVREYRHYGMDLNQNPDLRWAMNWAFGQDVPGLSGKQILDPEQPERTGLVIFLPVYLPGLDRSVQVGLTDWEAKNAATPEKQEQVKR